MNEKALLKVTKLGNGDYVIGNFVPGTTKHFKEICFSELKNIQQSSYLLDTGAEAQPLLTCLHLFVFKLTYTADSRVMDSAETILLDDNLFRYLKAVYIRC